MKKPSNSTEMFANLIGLGNQSARKSYYSELVNKVAELEREKDRYKWLFENAQHGIFQAHLDAGIVAANAAVVNLCGYQSAEEFCEKVSQLESLLFCCADGYSDFRYQMAQFGRVIDFETLFLRSDGQCVHVSISAVSKEPEGEYPLIEVFVKDITERKKNQDRLKQINEELEERVNHRTQELLALNGQLQQEIEERELIQQQLKVAKDSAEQANSSKDKYLAAASHDLLQPMNAARLLIAALMERSLEEQDAHLVNRVHLALENAEDLLTDLLDISKLDQNAVKPDISEFRIDRLLESMVNEFQPVAESKGLELRLSGSGAAVKSDSRLLLRIIRNFISNAIRYTDTGKVLVGCRRKGDLLSIQVWDTGIGIPEEKQKMIFKEFQQLQNPVAKDRQGVGLGLAIVERIAVMLGHSIQIRSQLHKGSAFSITVPLVDKIKPMSSVSMTDLIPVNQLTNLAVLVVDNEEAIQASMSALLRQWGCFVLTASNCVQALQACDEQGVIPEVVLADYHLDHGLLGTDAITDIRKHFGLDIPAVIVTADRSSECMQQFQAADLPVINKPVKPGKLRALLTHFCQ